MKKSPTKAIHHLPDLARTVDARRARLCADLDSARQRRLGQFLTTAPVAAHMASLLRGTRKTVRILEPGAGVGSLVAAVALELSARSKRPERLEVTAVEVDSHFIPSLRRTLSDCKSHCAEYGIDFGFQVIQEDFIEFASLALNHQLAFDAPDTQEYDLVILNPPYRKLASSSRERHALRRIGIEVGNLYAAFLALSAKLLSPTGELVAITPRSFCNGPYFRAFRKLLLELVSFSDVHVIESRSEAFAEDGVLQENVIFRAQRGVKRLSVMVTAGNGSLDSKKRGRRIPYADFVSPRDPDAFIHIAPDSEGVDVAARIQRLPCELADLGVAVSTGRVVDFRAKRFLRRNPASGTAPLVYPAHFEAGFIQWPRETRKPNAILIDEATAGLLVPEGVYVVVKRFSAKEERRRIVAAVFDPARVEAGSGVGFENHLNYYHLNGRGLERHFALGLGAYLNSTLVDAFFRQFSGHTQVNAADLRKLRYPSASTLSHLGREISEAFPDQARQ